MNNMHCWIWISFSWTLWERSELLLCSITLSIFTLVLSCSKFAKSSCNKSYCVQSWVKLFLLSLKDFVPVPNYSVVNKINFSMPYKLHKAKVVLKKNKKIYLDWERHRRGDSKVGISSWFIQSYAKKYGFDKSTLRFRSKRRDTNLRLKKPNRKYVSKIHLLLHHLNIAIASLFNFLVFFLIFGELEKCKHIYV